jgi:hypothetical protein
MLAMAPGKPVACQPDLKKQPSLQEGQSVLTASPHYLVVLKGEDK